MILIADEKKLSTDVQAKQVIERLQGRYTDNNVYVYYKYPIFRGDLPEELVQAHLLVTSPIFGVVYIACKVGDIIDDTYYEYLESLDSNLFKKFVSRPELRQSKRELKFDVTGLVLWSETKEERDTQFSTLDDLIELIEQHRVETPLSEDEYTILVSCIDNTTKMITKKQRPESSPKDGKPTKGMILDIIQQKETCFDQEQRKVAMVSIDSPQRIRGLAGSGKTILLTMKAALYHLSNPEAEILYTYYTKDLYDLIRRLIERFYRESADNHEPNWKKIHIYHAWGGFELSGVYSTACSDLGEPTIDFRMASRYNPQNPFDYVCNSLLSKDIRPKYDLTLIDEGQDFPNSFYRLCYKLTKERRIVWAYDEFQNIFNINVQDEKKTFGSDANGNFYVDFSRRENPYQDITLKCCYRNPRLVLIGAFTLGLGIYNKKVLQRLESNPHWESLGFQVEKGNCNVGDEMVISRPVENTPSITNEQLGSYSMQWRSFDKIEEECAFVSQSIIDDINNEGLLPDDICVICVDPRNITSYYSQIGNALKRNGIKVFNMLNAPNANRRFSYEGFVTLATLNKAKGNETGMVYIVGADALFKNPDNVLVRNRLFTAITRAKGWVTISGTGKEAMKICDQELAQLKANSYKLVFRQPSEEQTRTVMAGSMKQQIALKDMKNTIDELKKSGMSIEEIIQIIQEK